MNNTEIKTNECLRVFKMLDTQGKKQINFADFLSLALTKWNEMRVQKEAARRRSLDPNA